MASIRIEQVDAFYLRMPVVRDVGDGSQDALLIRVAGGGFIGWGECEASPLPTIAALVAPMSHSACRPVLDSVLGAELNGPEDLARIHRAVRENSQDLLQADHALSGIDIALWDLLGRSRGVPVWSFFSDRNDRRIAYASQLFAGSSEATYALAMEVRNKGFRAAKFGWGPIGRAGLSRDIEQIEAARSGLGDDLALMIDTGCVFGHDLEEAALRIPAFEMARVTWWEEPFATGGLAQYAQLARRTSVALAGGEGCHTADQARHFVEYGGIGYIQIDTGRVGGITAAREVARFTERTGVRYVNHTFTSNLALSASLQPFADAPEGSYAEVPVDASELAVAIGGPPWPRDKDGCIKAPEGPGIGIEPDVNAIKPYLQEVEIRWQGKPIWRSQPP